MKLNRLAALGAIAAVASLSLTACAANEGAPAASESASALQGTLNGSGATSQQVAIQAWTAQFQSQNEAVTVNYDPQGSGTGRESFQSGAVQFAGSDRAFKTDEISTGTFGACAADSDIVEIPAYISPLAVIFTLDGVDELDLDAKTLAGIFAGTITSWDDPAIAATNPDAQLPATKITPVHRSDKSGTTANFTDYLAANAPDVWTAGSVEEWPTATGEAAQGTSGVVNAVKGGQGTIGYADSSQATGIASVNVQVGDAFVGHSAEGAAIAVDASPAEEGRADTDLAIKIDRTTTAEGAYPVVLVSYLIGCAQYEDANTAALVKGFFSAAISTDGQNASADNAGSAPISDALRTKAAAAVDAIK